MTQQTVQSMIEDLKKRTTELSSAAAQMRHAGEQLAEVEAKVKEEFGTSDVAELEKLLEEKRDHTKSLFAEANTLLDSVPTSNEEA